MRDYGGIGCQKLFKIPWRHLWTTPLDKRSEMIIFESLLTTLESSVIFWGSWGSSKIAWA